MLEAGRVVAGEVTCLISICGRGERSRVARTRLDWRGDMPQRYLWAGCALPNCHLDRAEASGEISILGFLDFGLRPLLEMTIECRCLRPPLYDRLFASPLFAKSLI